MRTRLTLLIAVACLIAAGGCVRRDGRNAECRWPPEAGRRSPTPRHLSADAEFAEDLAIRYADTQYGLHTPNYSSPQIYGSARDGCMQQLFQQVAREHGVPVEEVSRSLAHNRTFVDVAETVPFVLLYIWAAGVAAGRIWRRYSPRDSGLAPATVLTCVAALLFAGLGMLLLESWTGMAETVRVGNAHMSYRLQRLLWARHRVLAFASLLAIFLLVQLLWARRSSGRAPLEHGESEVRN